MNEIKEYWDRIEQWLSKNMPDGLSKLAGGASEEDIAAFETDMGTRLPADFRASPAIHNGNNKKTVLLNDGRDIFQLLSLDEIKEEYRRRNKNKEEISEAYREAGETFSGRDLPVLYFSTGDYTCLNTGTGILSYVSHDGDSSKLKDFGTLLKMNADNLESGRFYIDQYGSIGTLYIDEVWKKVAELPEFSGRLNEPLHRSKRKVLREFFKAKGSSYDHEVNEHFERTYTINHNGQVSGGFLFFDGEEHFEFLSAEGFMEEYEEPASSGAFLLPIFKNRESGNTIFIEPKTDGYNTSALHKKYESQKRVERMPQDLVDILLATYRFYKT
ncbi:MAG: hypothetical protein GY765_41410 [bacterium]|nr:hypothetical protein [bacterium]